MNNYLSVETFSLILTDGVSFLESDALLIDASF